MKNPASIFQKYSTIRFGDLPSDDTADIYRRLNDHVPALCRSLPRGAQTEALIFLMQYAGIQVGEPLEFFKFYYRPAWSVLYWLTAQHRESGTVSDEEVGQLLGGQAMAMLLHPLDDHLVDGDVPVTHMTLLVRGQAWLRMNDCMSRFCAGVPGGIEMAREFVDDYYAGIMEKEAPGSLDLYCSLFRKQMATWVIMPVLAARRTGGDDGFVADLRSAYESFGIAWRLLDDLQDLEADTEKGERSAVYACLDRDGRALWDSLARSRGRAAVKSSKSIIGMLERESVLPRIAARIEIELNHAAALADKIGLGGLAGEFRTLAGPVAGWPG